MPRTMFWKRVFGRDLLWRIGRWLYTGARREMSHSMDTNGEIALQKRMATHFEQTSRGDPIVLDVGANLGAWSQPFGRALHAAGITKGRLIAFEPGPGQRERLEVNLFGRARFRHGVHSALCSRREERFGRVRTNGR